MNIKKVIVLIMITLLLVSVGINIYYFKEEKRKILNTTIINSKIDTKYLNEYIPETIIKLYLNNKNIEAINELSVLKDQNFNVLYLSGICYHELKYNLNALEKFDKALNAIKEIDVHSPQQFDCILRLAQLKLLLYMNYTDRKDIYYNEYKDLLFKSANIYIDKNNIIDNRYYILLSYYYCNNGEFDKGIKAFRQINKYEIYSDYKWMFNAIGYSILKKYYFKNDNANLILEYAREVFEFAYKVEPESSYVNNNLGYVYLSLGTKYNKAKLLFEKAIEINPYYKEAQNNLNELNKRMSKIK